VACPLILVGMPTGKDGMPWAYPPPWRACDHRGEHVAPKFYRGCVHGCSKIGAVLAAPQKNHTVHHGVGMPTRGWTCPFKDRMPPPPPLGDMPTSHVAYPKFVLFQILLDVFLFIFIHKNVLLGWVMFKGKKDCPIQ